MTPHTVFVLVGTTHTGNIGAAARAMKTMGFDQLRLVDTCSHLSDEARARASGADNVLKNAQRFESLADAIADCHAVVGTSARQRSLAVPVQHCREVAEQLADASRTSTASRTLAVVFGRERSGLSNEELDLCTHLLRIPCNPDFSSLNLGSAVQVVSYELSQAMASTVREHSSDCESGVVALPDRESAQLPLAGQDAPASSASMEHLFDHLQRVMLNTGFLDPDNPRHLMRRVRRYFERNRPSDVEVNIFRGLLSATENPRPPGDDRHETSPN